MRRTHDRVLRSRTFPYTVSKEGHIIRNCRHGATSFPDCIQPPPRSEAPPTKLVIPRAPGAGPASLVQSVACSEAPETGRARRSGRCRTMLTKAVKDQENSAGAGRGRTVASRRPATARDQNWTRRPSCTRRGPGVLVAPVPASYELGVKRMKVFEVNEVSGAPQFGWLKMFATSTRNSGRNRPTGNDLNSDRSGVPDRRPTEGVPPAVAEAGHRGAGRLREHRRSGCTASVLDPTEPDRHPHCR